MKVRARGGKKEGEGGTGSERTRNRRGGKGGGQDRDAAQGALGVKEEKGAREGCSERAKGGRQLLKAIALPPGRLRRAESVEMLNLA